jgi:hypothetical protein
MNTRTVLVTGAGRGIAVRLARSGWRVYAGVRTDVASKELAAESDMITPVALDVTVPEHVATLDRELPEALDALVNNAGIGVAGPLETLSRVDPLRCPGRPRRAGGHRHRPLARDGPAHRPGRGPWTPSTGRSTRRISPASASWSRRSARTPSRPSASPPP